MSNALTRRSTGGKHLRVLHDPPVRDDDVPSTGEPDADATTAVVAHGLLGNLAVIRGVARLLIGEHDMPEPDRSNLLEMLDSQVNLVQGVLTDLIRGMPSNALAALDELRR